MTLIQLKYAITVAGEHSLNDAAKKLYISQPSLSSAIHSLEKEIGLGFAQGEQNSFYFSEEVLSTYRYKRFIRANDRATMLNLMVGLNGFTLCSGIICEELNGKDYCAVKLKSDEKMTIGYIAREDAVLSPIGEKYLQELMKYQEENCNGKKN